MLLLERILALAISFRQFTTSRFVERLIGFAEEPSFVFLEDMTVYDEGAYEARCKLLGLVECWLTGFSLILPVYRLKLSILSGVPDKFAVPILFVFAMCGKFKPLLILLLGD